MIQKKKQQLQEFHIAITFFDSWKLEKALQIFKVFPRKVYKRLKFLTIYLRIVAIKFFCKFEKFALPQFIPKSRFKILFFSKLNDQMILQISQNSFK